jgi:hypothetical protein
MLPGPDFTDCLWLGFGALVTWAGVGSRRERAKPREQTIVSGSRAAPNYRTAKWLAAIGAALLLYGSSELYTGWSSLSWPTVNGKTLYSAAHLGPQSHTRIWYEYYVNNRRFVADTYRFGGNGTPFDDVAVAAAKRYAPGRVVTVYYNPSNPAEALLEPGAWYGNFVIPALGLLCFAAAWLAKKYAQAVSRP